MTITPLPIDDYARIYSAIHALAVTNGNNTNHSCLYFSILGCLILNKHYNIESQVVMGLAAYMINQEEERILLFAEHTDQGITSTERGFHAWVETKDWHIDFMAPQFHAICKERGIYCAHGPKMFQKHKTHAATSGKELKHDGDFYAAGNYNLTQAFVNDFFASQDNCYMAEFCLGWFRRPPQNMAECINGFDSRGNPKSLRYKDLNLEGIW